MNLTVIEPKAAEAHFHSHSAFAFAEKCRTDCQARRGNRPQTRGKLGGGPFQGTERRGWPCPPHPCRPSPTGPGPGRLATRAPSDAGDPHLRPGACLRPAGAPAPPQPGQPSNRGPAGPWLWRPRVGGFGFVATAAACAAADASADGIVLLVVHSSSPPSFGFGVVHQQIECIGSWPPSPPCVPQ